MSKKSPFELPKTPEDVFRLAQINNGAAIIYYLTHKAPSRKEDNDAIIEESKGLKHELALAVKLRGQGTYSAELAADVYKRHKDYVQRGWFDREFETLKRYGLG